MARKKSSRTKRGTKKRGGKKGSPALFLSLLAFSGAAALFVASFLYLGSPGFRSAPPPFVETQSPARGSLSRQIGKIDQAVYRYLHERKIPQGNIAFLSVRPKHDNLAEWDFTELLVRTPGGEVLSTFEKDLARIFSSHEPPVRIRAEGGGGRGERVVHLYAGHYYTHMIRIRPEARRTAAAPEKKKPRIALIVDDLGYDSDLAESLMNLRLSLNLAVLPNAPFGRAISEAARKKGWEVILHLPMEPENHPHVDPGPGALLTSMSEKEIRILLEEHLKQVPGARGVNNHMGSRFTRSEAKMEILLGELKRKGLFYVDSRTTNRTVAMDVARKLGVAATERSVFLDNELTHEAMAFQLQRLLSIGRHSGSAVAIAHPHRETVDFLRKSTPLLKREAEVVHVSKLVR